MPTLHLAVAAIRKLQSLTGAELTAKDQILVDTLRGLAKRAAGKKQRQAPALTSPALIAITTTACQPRIGRGGFPESAERARTRGLVDIALCRILSDAGLRRSEATAPPCAQARPMTSLALSM